MRIAWRQRAHGATCFTLGWLRTPLSRSLCPACILRTWGHLGGSCRHPALLSSLMQTRFGAVRQQGPRGAKHSAYIGPCAGFASVNGPRTERGVLYQHRAEPLLHYWYAIWLPAINKLLRNWKLWSWTAPDRMTEHSGCTGVIDCWTPSSTNHWKPWVIQPLFSSFFLLSFSSLSSPTGFSRWLKAISLPPCVM